jgi:hypothetical protein
VKRLGVEFVWTEFGCGEGDGLGGAVYCSMVDGILQKVKAISLSIILHGL